MLFKPTELHQFLECPTQILVGETSAGFRPQFQSGIAQTLNFGKCGRAVVTYLIGKASSGAVVSCVTLVVEYATGYAKYQDDICEQIEQIGFKAFKGQPVTTASTQMQ